jgi:hypothetical protein
MLKNVLLSSMVMLFLVLGSGLSAQGLKDRMKKGDKTESSAEGGEEKKGGFADKMKAKAKGFNPMKSLGKLAGNILTSSTDDLSTASIRVFYTDNLVPADAGTIETEYWDFWESGISIGGVSFTKREGVGMLKIDGTVSIDGQNFEHVANGFYGGPTDLGKGAHTFDISMTNGQTVSLEASSIEPIEIVSINGVPKGEPVTVRIDEDLVLELNHPEGGTEDFYVQVMGEVFGVKTFNDIGFFKSVDKIVIPKEAFFNTSTSALKYIQGDNYLQVARTKAELKDVQGVGAVQIISTSQDWAKITFEGEGDKLLGVGWDKNYAAIENKYKDGFTNRATKSNAFWSPPFSEAKKVAIASFVVRATQLKQQETTTSSSTTGNIRTTTTTTITKTFPEVPEEYWDQLVEEAYFKFKEQLETQLGVEVIDIEHTIAAQQYDNMFSVEDTMATEIVVKPYKGCKLLIPTKLGEILTSASSTFPADLPDVKLVDELGVDAIVSATLDVSMSWEDQSLTPNFNFKLTGSTNGYKVGPLNYGQGSVRGPGTPLSESLESNEYIMEFMNDVMNLDRVIQLFGQSLSELKASEQGKGYEKIWALK